MRIAIKFAYNGMNFQGYARQPKLKTVEGDIIDLLIVNNIIKDAKESKFRSASRTDKGTSALGNVIAFNTLLNKDLVFNKLKNNKKNILFYGIKNVEHDFYPRYAKLRVYSYYLKKQDYGIEKIIDVTTVVKETEKGPAVVEEENPVVTLFEYSYQRRIEVIFIKLIFSYFNIPFK